MLDFFGFVKYFSKKNGVCFRLCILNGSLTEQNQCYRLKKKIIILIDFKLLFRKMNILTRLYDDVNLCKSWVNNTIYFSFTQDFLINKIICLRLYLVSSFVGHGPINFQKKNLNIKTFDSKEFLCCVTGTTWSLPRSIMDIFTVIVLVNWNTKFSILIQFSEHVIIVRRNNVWWVEWVW